VPTDRYARGSNHSTITPSRHQIYNDVVEPKHADGKLVGSTEGIEVKGVCGSDSDDHGRDVAANIVNVSGTPHKILGSTCLRSMERVDVENSIGPVGLTAAQHSKPHATPPPSPGASSTGSFRPTMTGRFGQAATGEPGPARPDHRRRSTLMQIWPPPNPIQWI
jgi:hypothetical protein